MVPAQGVPGQIRLAVRNRCSDSPFRMSTFPKDEADHRGLILRFVSRECQVTAMTILSALIEQHRDIMTA